MIDPAEFPLYQWGWSYSGIVHAFDTEHYLRDEARPRAICGSELMRPDPVMRPDLGYFINERRGERHFDYTFCKRCARAVARRAAERQSNSH